MSNNRISEIEFDYKRNPEYRVVYVNGAYGGPSPKGEYKIDLFLEQQVAPDRIKHSVNESGKLGDEIMRLPADRPVCRELQVGVIMTVGEARNLANWILLRIGEFEKQIKKD